MDQPTNTAKLKHNALGVRDVTFYKAAHKRQVAITNRVRTEANKERVMLYGKLNEQRKQTDRWFSYSGEVQTKRDQYKRDCDQLRMEVRVLQEQLHAEEGATKVLAVKHKAKSDLLQDRDEQVDKLKDELKSEKRACKAWNTSSAENRVRINALRDELKAEKSAKDSWYEAATKDRDKLVAVQKALECAQELHKASSKQVSQLEDMLAAAMNKAIRLQTKVDIMKEQGE